MSTFRGYLVAMVFVVLATNSAASAIVLQHANNIFYIDPATLQISVNKTQVNQAQAIQKVDLLESTTTQASWRWPERNVQLTAKLEDGDLRLIFSSDKQQKLSWFTLPKQASTLLLPIGEGSRIPLDNPVWQRYLVKSMAKMDTNWDLKLPLWSQQQQNKFYSWLLFTPFDNQIAFSQAGKRLEMHGSHQFNRFNQNEPFEVLLHVGTTQLSGAIRYREYLQLTDQFSTLQDKIRMAPEGEKLIGATHVYVWAGKLLAPADVINWPGVVKYLQSPEGRMLWEKIGTDAQKTILELKGGVPGKWQQQALIDGLNQAFFALRPLDATPDDEHFIDAQQQQAEQVNLLVQQQLGHYLSLPEQWGQGLTVPLVEALYGAGLPRLWLGSDNWRALFLQPQAVAQAKQKGYLVASYDSYDTAIASGINDDWLTAQMPSSIREQCAIVLNDGSKKPGFGRNGYYLNPECMLPYSQQRMSKLMQLANLNSLFIDVDGTGMVSDDYHPGRLMSAKKMADARNARMAWFVNALKLPLGSEDGNAVTVRYLMFAHGMQTWGFGWGDKEMHRDKSSPYYLGAWFPAFQPDLFFRSVKVKQPFRTVEFDPRYRLPLYQAVFHDAVISSHHWSYDNLKFDDVKRVRSLLGNLYNTAPMFHLSGATLSARLPSIKKADAVFRVVHQELWDKALIDFRWLDSEGWIQQTTFSDGSVLVANFSDKYFDGVAGYGFRATLADGRVVMDTE